MSGSLGVAAAGMSTPVRETSLEGPSAHGDPKVYQASALTQLCHSVALLKSAKIRTVGKNV